MSLFSDILTMRVKRGKLRKGVNYKTYVYLLLSYIGQKVKFP